MPFFETSAGRVAYSVQGDGPTLMLLHATLHDRHDFDAVLPALSETHRVIAVDWPAHGESETPDPPVTAELIADTLEQIVVSEDLGALRLIGNSVGGFAAARLAIRQPQRVAGVILVDNGGFGANNVFTRGFCRTMGTPAIARHIMPRFVHAYMRSQTPSDQRIARAAIARTRTDAGITLAASIWRSFAASAHDLRHQAAGLTAPTLIVWGRRDLALPLPIGKATHKQLPGSRLVVLDTGHVVFSSDPPGFLAATQPFLDHLAQAV